MAGIGGLTQDQIKSLLTTEMNLDPTKGYELNELTQRFFYSGLWLTLLGSGSTTGGLDVNVHDEAYGAVGDGVVDDTAAIQAAIDHVCAAGGGIVSLVHDDSVYKITSTLTVKEGVSLVGSHTSLVDMNYCTLLMSGSTARVHIGSDTARGGHSGFFNIDGNGAGNAAGILDITAVQQTISNITVTDAAGIGCNVFASQNCFIYSLDVNGSGTHNMVIDGGTGGMIFTRCELTSPGAGSYGLKITESNPGGHPGFGYQYGPVHNEWHHCIVEHYGTNDPAGLVLVESGTRQVFRSCGFSNSSDDTFTSGYQVRITNDCFPTLVTTIVEFNGCNFHGGNTHKYPAFYVQGTNTITKNTLVVTGQTHYQFSTSVYVTDGITVGNLSGHEDYTSVDALFNAIGAGSWFFWRRDSYTGIFIKMPDATGAWAGAYPMMVGKDNEAGARWLMTNEGLQGWCNGTNFTPLATLAYNAAAVAVEIVNFKVSGKRIVGQTDTLCSTGMAVSVDVRTGGPVYFFTCTGTGSIASFVLTNPTDRQEIEIGIYRTAAQAVVWPTAQYDIAGAPGAPAAGNILWVHLRYLASTGKWYEHKKRVETAV